MTENLCQDDLPERDVMSIAMTTQVTSDVSGDVCLVAGGRCDVIAGDAIVPPSQVFKSSRTQRNFTSKSGCRKKQEISF